MNDIATVCWGKSQVSWGRIEIKSKPEILTVWSQVNLFHLSRYHCISLGKKPNKLPKLTKYRVEGT